MVNVNDDSGYDAARLAALITEMRPRLQTAQELVLETLREAILGGVLPPGTRLRQEELATAFDTSRIPVREALRVLEYEGLVSSEPHRGFTVTSLDADEVEEIYDLRTVLETHAVRLAVPLLTEADLEELGALFQAIQDAPEDDSRLAARERFYQRLYAVTARPRLVGLISRLRQEVARSLRWLRVPHSPEHHQAFWEAVQSGDADLAAEQLASHYRKIAALLRRYLREGRLAGRGR
ncbi:MAG: GntR family transcriptional regulator [Chloroflexota bacterium]